jgi:hypothetical protein
MNIAIPPRLGVLEVCDVRTFGVATSDFALAMSTIEGISTSVMNTDIPSVKISRKLSEKK